MYDVIIKRQAQKKLKSLAASTRAKIAGLIKMMSLDPDDNRLDLDLELVSGELYLKKMR